MKAAIYEGPGKIAVREVPAPNAEPGGAVVRVRACAICGTDLRIFDHGDPKIAPPMTPGHEISGDIAELGEGVSQFKVGDRVALAPPGISCGECVPCRRSFLNLCLNRRIVGYHFPGGFAEYVAIPPKALEQGLLRRLPHDMPYSRGALVEPLGCVVNGQTPLGIKPGDAVAVFGAGPIGLLHARLASAKGARAFLVEVSTPRARKAESLGFQVVDASVGDPLERIRSLAPGGADVAIVAVSSGQAQEQAIESTGKRGRISFFAGLPQKQSRINIDSNRVHYFELSIFGASSAPPESSAEALEWLRSGSIEVDDIVTDRVPLEELPAALEMVRRREGLKVVVEP